MGIRIRTHAPILTNDTAAMTSRLIADVDEDVAQVGYDLVRSRLRSVLKHPTGYYESRVRVDVTTEGAVISDGGVVYGPWLEGTGSRNNTTRFKGYRTFRLTMQDLAKRAQRLADDAAADALRRLK